VGPLAGATLVRGALRQVSAVCYLSFVCLNEKQSVVFCAFLFALCQCCSSTYMIGASGIVGWDSSANPLRQIHTMTSILLSCFSLPPPLPTVANNSPCQAAVPTAACCCATRGPAHPARCWYIRCHFNYNCDSNPSDYSTSVICVMVIVSGLPCFPACRSLPGSCAHSCLLLCHPGPCPPCPLLVDARCFCGKAVMKQRCGKNEFSCRGVCGRRLACGHACPEVCHAGECPPCQQVCGVSFLLLCILGNMSHVWRQWMCNACRSIMYCLFLVLLFSFTMCGQLLACGHSCPEVCHAGECPPCQQVSGVCFCHVCLTTCHMCGVDGCFMRAFLSCAACYCTAC
jgi:hypothetical protein